MCSKWASNPLLGGVGSELVIVPNPGEKWDTLGKDLPPTPNWASSLKWTRNRVSTRWWTLALRPGTYQWVSRYPLKSWKVNWDGLWGLRRHHCPSPPPTQGPCSPKPVLFECLFPLHSSGSLKATVSLGGGGGGGETGSRRSSSARSFLHPHLPAPTPEE